MKFIQEIQTMSNDKFNLLFIPLLCISIFLYVVFRNLGLEPFIFADEYLYSKYARLTEFAQSDIPAYIYFLLFRITDLSKNGFLEAARIINASLFVFSFPFIYLVCRKVANRNTALFVAFFSLLDPLNSYTAYFMPEATYFLAFWVFCWFVISYIEIDKLYYGMISGAILALMSMIKPHAIFLLPAFVVFLFTSHFFDRKGLPLKWIGIALSTSLISFFLVRFSLGYLFAGEAGLSLFGKFYTSTAGNSFSFDFLYQLIMKSFQPFLQNILILIAIFGVPIAIICNINFSTQKLDETGRYQQRIQIFLISFLFPLILITALFTAHVTSTGPYEIVGRVHMRYYSFITPLLFILAAGGLSQAQQLSSKTIKSSLIVLTLLALSMYLILVEKTIITPNFPDCPHWLGLIMRKTFFYVLSILGIISLIIWGAHKRWGASFYLYIYMPIFVLITSYNINTVLRNNWSGTVYDHAGKLARDFLKDNFTKLVVIGSDHSGLFRTLFHIDSLKAELLLLPPESPLDLSLIPPTTEYVVLIGNHAGLENNFRWDFPEFSIIQLLKNKNLNFGKATPPFVKVEGLSIQEPWGRWSDGDKVKLTFTTALPKEFTLSLKANAFGPNAQKDFTVTIGQEIKRFRLTNPNDTISLDFTNVQNEKSIIITIPQPTSPKQLGISADDRLLGIGLIELNINSKKAE